MGPVAAVGLHPGGPPPAALTVFVLTTRGEPAFPAPTAASAEGLLAIGGDLSPARLLAAYRLGIFPWYNPGQPILWWCPDPRAVLFPPRLHVSRSLKKTLRQQRFHVTFDTAFMQVVQGCAGPRPQYPEGGTWITPEMQEAYLRLHNLGYAHSVEAWREGVLCGGLYGVALGRIFFGESMFSLEADASKVAFVEAVRQLDAWGYELIDCQMESAHLARFGAQSIPRAAFLKILRTATEREDRPGRWRADLSGVK